MHRPLKSRGYLLFSITFICTLLFASIDTVDAAACIGAPPGHYFYVEGEVIKSKKVIGEEFTGTRYTIITVPKTGRAVQVDVGDNVGAMLRQIAIGRECRFGIRKSGFLGLYHCGPNRVDWCSRKVECALSDEERAREVEELNTKYSDHKFHKLWIEKWKKQYYTPWHINLP